MRYFVLIEDEYTGDYYLHSTFDSENSAKAFAITFVDCKIKIVEGKIAGEYDLTLEED